MNIVADGNIPFVEECFSSIGQVRAVPAGQIDYSLVKDADILLVRSVTKVDAGLLEGSKVSFVGTATIGTDHIDQEYLAGRDIAFAYAPGSNANSVAEYVTCALLALAKKHGFELEGKSIGIIGVGNVGSKVERMARALGMKVFLHDPPLQRQAEDDKYLSLQELFACDFITLHAPLTFEGRDKTFHLADETFFGSLKDGVFFINTSRGAVVDTAALKNAMNNGKTGGVVLDVWENEPNIDGELIQRVDLSTPHIAGYSYDGKVVGMIMLYKAVCEFLGEEPVHDAADLLPDPDVPEIVIDPDSDAEQNVLHQATQRIYVINRDDFNTREILLVPQEQRGQFFTDLRKDYPVRREFYNTFVSGVDKNSSLAAKLSGIGFRV